MAARPLIVKNMSYVVGARIRAAREAASLTMAELGDEIGISFQQVQKFEAGVNELTIGRLVQLANALDIEASELLGSNSELMKAGAKW